MPKKKDSTRDRCARFCGGKLDGIVENLKLRGELPEDKTFRFKQLRGLVYIPAGAYEIVCPLHHNTFLVVGEDGKPIVTKDN